MDTGRTEMKGRKAFRKGRRILWIILAVVLCWAYWILFFQYVIPWERTLFLINQSFREKADFVGRNYPPELPAVAEDIRYYYGRSGIVINAGMSFTVSGDEYQELKETYLSRYEERKEEYLRESRQSLEDDQKSCKEWETSGGTIYEFNRTVTSEIFKEGGLDYLEKISRNKIEDYTILADEKMKGQEDAYWLNGILFNDDTHEIVFFGVQTIYRKAREQDWQQSEFP